MTAVPTGNTYDKYGSQNPIERRLMNRFFGHLDRALPTAAPATMLEVGVGEGEVAERVASRFPDCEIIGLDLPDEDLAGSWTGRAMHPLFGDIHQLPFPDDRFDLVLAIEVLEHVDDPDRALAELCRVGRDRVVVSVPREPIWRAANMARGKYLSDLGNTPGHIQHWSKRGIASLVARHAEIVSVTSPFPWTVVSATIR